jgi:hypothetical protein
MFGRFRTSPDVDYGMVLACCVNSGSHTRYCFIGHMCWIALE